MRALDLYAGLGCYTWALRGAGVFSGAGVEVLGAAERDDWLLVLHAVAKALAEADK